MVYQFIFGAMWAHGMNWCEGKRQMTSTVFCCSTVLFIWGSVLAVCSIKWAQVRFVGEWESVQPIWSENFPTKRCAWRSVMRLNTQLFKISSMMSLCLLSKRVWRMAGQEKPWKFWVIITIKEGKLLTGHRISTHICLAQWILYMLIICWMSWSCPVLRSVSLSCRLCLCSPWRWRKFLLNCYQFCAKLSAVIYSYFFSFPLSCHWRYLATSPPQPASLCPSVSTPVRIAWEQTDREKKS